MKFEIPTLASETLFHIGSFEVRNTLIMAWIVMALLLGAGFALRRKGYAMLPGRFQAAVELMIEGLYSFFASIFGDERRARYFFPLLATIFFFIISANWLGILPGVGSITILGIHEGHVVNIPILRSMNADVNITLVFSIVAIIVAQVFGMTALGILPHVRKYAVAPWKRPFVIGSFVGVLEFIGEFTRIASFTFRLFGNIFAGEVLLMVISQLVPYLVPIPFIGLEIFVGAIQAMVFSMLTAVFISMAAISHENHADGVAH